MKKLLKSALIQTALKSGFASVSDYLCRKQLRILGYHGAWITPGYTYSDKMYMPIKQFESRMRWLKQSKYSVIPLNQAISELETNTLSDRSVVITFDDGWQTTFSHMLPILDELAMPATVYQTSWYVENRLPVLDKVVDFLVSATQPERVKILDREFDLRLQRVTEIVKFIEQQPLSERTELVCQLSAAVGIPTDLWQSSGQFNLMTQSQVVESGQRGFDIQLHTHRHTELDQAPTGLQQEIADNRNSLSALVPNQALNHFCYPSGAFHPGAPKILQDEGVRSASLCTPGLNKPGCDLYRLNRFLDGRSIDQPLFEAWLSGLTNPFSKQTLV